MRRRSHLRSLYLPGMRQPRRQPVTGFDVHVEPDDDGTPNAYVVSDAGREIRYGFDELVVREAVAELHERRLDFYRRLERGRRVKAFFRGLVGARA